MFSGHTVLWILSHVCICVGFLDGAVVKNLPANAGNTRDTGCISGLGRFPGVGDGNPLRYSCLENSMDRGAWQAAVYGVAKSWTQLSYWAHTHTHTHTCICIAITTLRIQNSSTTATPKLPWTFSIPDLFSITIVFSFPSCHKNGTIQYVTLCDNMSLRFIQSVPWINTLLFFYCWVLLCCVDVPSFIYPFIHWRAWGWFRV